MSTLKKYSIAKLEIQLNNNAKAHLILINENFDTLC